MEQMTLSELFSKFLAACGAATVIAAAVAAVRRLFNPAFSIRKRVRALEEKDKNQQQCNKDVNQLLEEIAETNKLLCRSMMVLLDHSITGNGIEDIKKVKSSLVNYLAEK
jgi:septal ring factor EnvC (AmiA/AmiB activator)